MHEKPLAHTMVNEIQSRKTVRIQSKMSMKIEMLIYMRNTLNRPGGLVIKALTWHVKNVGLSPIWFQFFSVEVYRCLTEKDLFL